MKILIDTCVILDALQSRQPFAQNAELIFLLAAKSRFEACITAKSLTDIYYLTHRLTHNDRETRRILRQLLMVFTPLDTLREDCILALQSEMTDYEDAVMAASACREHMDYIVTRNTADYAKSPVPAINPEEFLSFFPNDIGKSCNNGI